MYAPYSKKKKNSGKLPEAYDVHVYVEEELLCVTSVSMAFCLPTCGSMPSEPVPCAVSLWEAAGSHPQAGRTGRRAAYTCGMSSSSILDLWTTSDRMP